MKPIFVARINAPIVVPIHTSKPSYNITILLIFTDWIHSRNWIRVVFYQTTPKWNYFFAFPFIYRND